jgi:hypothetical protein
MVVVMVCVCVELSSVELDRCGVLILSPSTLVQDELGGMLLLNMPNTIVHRIDSWSPLLPPAPHAHVGKWGLSGQSPLAGSSCFFTAVL